MKAQVEIFSCPFCGSEDVEICKTGPYWVRCAECGAESESDDRRYKAIAKWNRRVPAKIGRIVSY